jgi:hypothetical protein
VTGAREALCQPHRRSSARPCAPRERQAHHGRGGRGPRVRRGDASQDLGGKADAAGDELDDADHPAHAIV